MSYEPKITDPRVLKRIRHAYGFTKGCLSPTKSHSWAKVVIDKYYGRSNNELGNYLRNTLLICTSDRYNKDTGETKQYKSNQQGLDYIKQLIMGQTSEEFTQWAQNNGYKKKITSLTTTTPSVQLLFDHYCVSKFIENEYGSELGNLNFIYQDKSNRLWHPIQNVKKDYKKSIFSRHGLSYQYDIDACAPTLIHQLSQKVDMDLYLFSLRHYLKDKTMIRNELAKQLDVDSKTIKIIINALFCGARIGNSKEFAISQLLNNDIAKIQFLKEDPFISELRNDIKIMWEYIEPIMAKTYTKTKSGKQRKLPLSSKKKWHLYFDLERQILNQVRNYLTETNNRHFLEHDGWATEHQVNEHELNQYIMYKTGFDVKFKMEVLNKNISLTTTTPSVQLLYGHLTADIDKLKQVIK